MEIYHFNYKYNMEQNLNPTMNGVNGSNMQTTSQQNVQMNTAQPATPSEAVVLHNTDFELPLDIRQQIAQKIAELKVAKKVKRVFVIIVQGDVDAGELPYYIGYFRRPNLMEFSQYMNFAQKDISQASFMLAQQVFLDGNKELVDDQDLFLYGTMSQLNHIIDSRNSDIVKK